MVAHAVPLFGVNYKDGRAFDPRHPQLRAALLRAGLDVRRNDAVYVYVAGWLSDLDDGLQRAGLRGVVRVTVVGCTRLRSCVTASECARCELTDAAN